MDTKRKNHDQIRTPVCQRPAIKCDSMCERTLAQRRFTPAVDVVVTRRLVVVVYDGEGQKQRVIHDNYLVMNLEL